jgi:hypothetical protein
MSSPIFSVLIPPVDLFQEMGAEASREVGDSDEEHDHNLGMLLQWPALQRPPDAVFLKLLLLM